jgi:hypothetical protein
VLSASNTQILTDSTLKLRCWLTTKTVKNMHLKELVRSSNVLANIIDLEIRDTAGLLSLGAIDLSFLRIKFRH